MSRLNSSQANGIGQHHHLSDQVVDANTGEPIAGFPPQWTGPAPDGSVTIATDDPAVVPLTVVGATNHDGSVFQVLSQAGSDIPGINAVADGAGAIDAVYLKANSAVELTAHQVSIGAVGGEIYITATNLMYMKVPLSEPAYSMNQFGQLLIWLDNTAGSAKLKFKTMDSSEVIVHGEVALVP